MILISQKQATFHNLEHKTKMLRKKILSPVGCIESAYLCWADLLRCTDRAAPLVVRAPGTWTGPCDPVRRCCSPTTQGWSRIAPHDQKILGWIPESRSSISVRRTMSRPTNNTIKIADSARWFNDVCVQLFEGLKPTSQSAHLHNYVSKLIEWN